MATLPVPATVEIQLRGKHGADDRISTVHYRHGGIDEPISTSRLETMAINWITNVLPYLVPLVTAGTSWQKCVARDISRHGGAVWEQPILTANVGTHGGSPAPGNVGVAVAKDSDAHAKGETGRFWIMDIDTASVLDAVINGAFQALIVVLMGALQQHISDGVALYAPVVASKKHGVYHTITGMTTDSTTDEIITRLRGHKKHRRRRVISV